MKITQNPLGSYIVLPWNLGSQVGRDNLKNLINRIPNNVRELKYIIYVKDYENLSSLSLESSKDLSQSLTSLASLHLDETESLVNKIDDLEKQIEDLQNKLYIRLQADRNQNWTVALPKNNLSAGSNIAANMNFSGILSENVLEVKGLDISLLKHISPIGWNNVILYGEYIINKNLIRR